MRSFMQVTASNLIYTASRRYDYTTIGLDGDVWQIVRILTPGSPDGIGLYSKPTQNE